MSPRVPNDVVVESTGLSRRALLQENVPDAPTREDASNSMKSTERANGRLGSPYAWPLLWVFPLTILTIVFVFKGLQCHRVASWTFRRCRRWRRASVCCCCCCSIEDEDSDEETSESERRGNGRDGDEERGHSSIVRVLDGDVAEMSRALGEDARDDGDRRGGRFEPDLWRYLAVERDLERRRRRYDAREASTHREPMVELPIRTRADPPSAYDRSNKAVPGASRRALKYLPRCVVGSPRWFQFLRANGHIDVKITPQGIVRHVLDHSAEECVVCCDDFKDEDLVVVLKCAHAFHESCAIPWLRLHASCPICRREVTRMSLVDRHGVFTSRRRRPRRLDAAQTPAERDDDDDDDDDDDGHDHVAS